MINRKLKVTGKVQGVYYRVSAKQKAMMLGLNGYVRNERDGSVSLNIQGEDEAVEEMTRWCKKGPALARVSTVDIQEGEEVVNQGFDVIH